MADNIRKRKDGRYEARIVLRGERISLYGKTRTEVQAKIKQKKWEVEHQKEIARSDKLSDSMERWLTTTKRASNIKPSSYDRVESTFNMHVLTSDIAKKRINAIESGDIQALLNIKRDAGYSYSTIKKIYDLCREFFRYQVDSDNLIKDPMRMVKMPRIENRYKEIEFFTLEEMRKIIEVAELTDDDGNVIYRYGEAIVLLLLTGLRNGELRALTIDSVDFDNKMLHVDKTISRAVEERKGKRVNMVYSPKTRNSVRDIPLTKRAEKAVRALIDTTYDERTGYLITTKNGNVMTHALLQRAYDRILKRAGLEHKGLHSTRHTFGTIQVKNAEGEGQIKEISEILGHSRVSTTYDYYVGTSMTDKVKLMNRLDDII